MHWRVQKTYQWTPSMRKLTLQVGCRWNRANLSRSSRSSRDSKCLVIVVGNLRVLCYFGTFNFFCWAGECSDFFCEDENENQSAAGIESPVSIFQSSAPVQNRKAPFDTLSAFWRVMDDTEACVTGKQRSKKKKCCDSAKKSQPNSTTRKKPAR